MEQESLLGRPFGHISKKKLFLIVIVSLLVALIICMGIIGLVTLKRKNDGKSNPKIDYQYWHQQFQEKLDPEKIKDEMKYFSSVPHIAGSANDFEQAQYVQQKYGPILAKIVLLYNYGLSQQSFVCLDSVSPLLLFTSSIFLRTKFSNSHFFRNSFRIQSSL